MLACSSSSHSSSTWKVPQQRQEFAASSYNNRSKQLQHWWSVRLVLVWWDAGIDGCLFCSRAGQSVLHMLGRFGVPESERPDWPIFVALDKLVSVLSSTLAYLSRASQLCSVSGAGVGWCVG